MEVSENYSSKAWPVWKLEQELERIDVEIQAKRALAKHITTIRDKKLANGEPQGKPWEAPPIPGARPGLLKRLKEALGAPKAGPSHQVLVPDGIASQEKGMGA